MILQRLKAVYAEWNNPPSDGLPPNAGILLEAAGAIRERDDEIERLAKDRDEWIAQCNESEADRDDYKSQINEAWAAAQAELCKAIDMRKRAESAERKLAMAVGLLREKQAFHGRPMKGEWVDGGASYKLACDLHARVDAALAELEKAEN